MGMAVCSVGVCDGQRWGSQGRSGSSCQTHTHTHSSCALLPSAGQLLYCNTWPRVSGNFVARKLPAASAPAANKMGTALVMPTNDWKILMPRTAATLQSAFRKPNAVVLNRREEGQTVTVKFQQQVWSIIPCFKLHSVYLDMLSFLLLHPFLLLFVVQMSQNVKNIHLFL